jgi:hypothetical protein
MHLKDELPDKGNKQQQREARKRIHEKTVAYGILVRAERSRHRKLIEEIENDFFRSRQLFRSSY